MSGDISARAGLLADGGARQGEADLWCSYAAIRTLRWLGGQIRHPDGAARYLLSRQNADGAFAWQRGLPSDLWATYYCVQALTDLGRSVPQTAMLGKRIADLRTADGGYSMTTGQNADIWAVYYASRVRAEILRSAVTATDRLARWLARTQTRDGGLTWAPGAGVPDVRACYYGAVAWRAVAGSAPVPWRRESLVRWLRGQQEPNGGFRFAPGYEPCVWATFRAVRALDALGAGPADRGAARRWLSERRLSDGGFERWEGYGRSDVWACFSVVGALSTLGVKLGDQERAAVEDFIQSCRIPGSGFTYTRPGAAGDSLATSAALLLESLQPTADPRRVGSLTGWLQDAHLPYEGGVMYMPGRGAEVRCTLWAVEALRTAPGGQVLEQDRLGRWIRGLQNPDGGFGYWLGRGSDMVSTVSAVEVAAACGRDPREWLDAEAVLGFLDACRAGVQARPVPGAQPTSAATAQAARALDLVGRHAAARELGVQLAGMASPLGGFGAAQRALPDLMTTYQVVLTQQALELPVDLAALRRFLDRLRAGPGFAWSPISRQPAGPLAACLGAELARFAAGDGPPLRLPRLNL